MSNHPPGWPLVPDDPFAEFRRPPHKRQMTSVMRFVAISGAAIVVVLVLAAILIRL